MSTDPARVQDVFLAAADLLDPDARAAFLDRACDGDAAFRGRVEALLKAHGQPDSLLDMPVLEGTGAETRTAEPTPGGTPESAATRSYGSDADRNPDDDLAVLSPSDRPGSLGRIGHYEVLEVLGRGGFGTVYRAFDDKLQRVVAVKVLSPALATTSPARKRFLREARATAAIKHDHVVQIYDTQEQPLPFLVMEYVPGETLQQRLDRTGPLEVAEVLRIGRQVADGLAAAHATGLVHRDIKPANVLIEDGPQHRVKLTDFGLARAADDASISHSGIVAGTPMYMAPEQAKGDTLDHRADLFSLGSVLYVMCTGRPPFRASGMMAVLKRVVEEDPRPIREVIPEVPDWLCRIVGKLHAKDPAERFQSSRDVADTLSDCDAQLIAHGVLKDYSRIPGGGKPRTKSKYRRFAATLCGIAALFWMAILFAEPAYRYATNQAAIEVRPESGLTFFTVWRDGQAVTDWYDSRTGPTIHLPPGTYKLDPKFSPGFTVERWEVRIRSTFSSRTEWLGDRAPEFEVRRGESATVRAVMRDDQSPVTRPTDEDRLQGRWRLVSMEQRGGLVPVVEEVPGYRVEFIGDERVTYADGKPVRVKFALKPVVEPKEMLSLPEGQEPIRHLYKFDADKLVIARGGAGQPRPTGFSTTPDTPFVVVTYVRDTAVSSADGDGFVPLFNGRDLTGWTPHKDSKGEWVVQDGALTHRGSFCSYLFTDRGDYGNFHLRAEAKINAGGDSGICFRSRLDPLIQQGRAPQPNPAGYEAQIAQIPQNRTGSLFVFTDERKSPYLTRETELNSPSDEWFTLEVVANGSRLQVFVNGKKIGDVGNDLYSRGHIALQHLGEKTAVHFRKIEIKELPARSTVVPRTAAEVLPFLAGNWKVEMQTLVPKPAPGAAPAVGQMILDYVADGKVLRSRASTAAGLDDVRFLYSFDPDRNVLRQWQAWSNGNAHGPFMGLFNPDNRTMTWRHKLNNNLESITQFDFVNPDTIRNRLVHQDASGTVVREMRMTFTRIPGPVELSTRPTDPNRRAEMKVLDRFVGDWRTDMTSTTAAEPGKPRTETARVTAASILGGRFLERTETHETSGGSVYSLAWFDADKKRYRQWYFSSAGDVGEISGTWDEASKTLTESSPDEGRFEGQTVFRTDDRVEFRRVFKATDGKKLFEATGESRRVAVASPPVVPKSAAEVLPFMAGSWKVEREDFDPKLQPEDEIASSHTTFEFIPGGRFLRMVKDRGFSLHYFDTEKNLLYRWSAIAGGVARGPQLGEFNPDDHSLLWRLKMPNGNDSVSHFRFVDPNTMTARLFMRDAAGNQIQQSRLTFTRVAAPVKSPELPIDPTRPAEMNVLDRLVGEWRNEVTVKSAAAPDKPMTQTTWTKSASILGGHFVEGIITDAKSSDYWLTWFDAGGKQYRSWLFTGAGQFNELTGNWDEAAKTLTWNSSENAKSGHWVFKTEDRREFQHTTKDKDGKVLTEVIGVSVRQVRDVPRKAADVLPFLAGNWKFERQDILPKPPPGTPPTTGFQQNDYVANGYFLRSRGFAVEQGEHLFLYNFDPAADALRLRTTLSTGYASQAAVFGAFNPDTRAVLWMARLPDGTQRNHEYRFHDPDTIVSRLYDQDANNRVTFETRFTFNRVKEPVATPTRPPDPTRPAEMKVLDRLVGEWRNEATVKSAAAPDKPTKQTSWMKGESILGGRFVEVTETDEATNAGDYTVAWFDVEAKRYRLWIFSGHGDVTELRGTWDEAAKSMTWNSQDGRSEARWVFKDADLREYQYRFKDPEGKVLSEVTGVSRRNEPSDKKPADPAK